MILSPASTGTSFHFVSVVWLLQSQLTEVTFTKNELRIRNL